MIAATDDNKEEAGKVGAIEAVTNAIKVHKEDETICCDGCRTLGSIALFRNNFSSVWPISFPNYSQ